MLQNPLTREGWYCRKEEVEKLYKMKILKKYWKYIALLILIVFLYLICFGVAFSLTTRVMFNFCLLPSLILFTVWFLFYFISSFTNKLDKKRNVITKVSLITCAVLLVLVHLSVLFVQKKKLGS